MISVIGSRPWFILCVFDVSIAFANVPMRSEYGSRWLSALGYSRQPGNKHSQLYLMLAYFLAGAHLLLDDLDTKP